MPFIGTSKSYMWYILYLRLSPKCCFSYIAEENIYFQEIFHSLDPLAFLKNFRSCVPDGYSIKNYNNELNGPVNPIEYTSPMEDTGKCV